MSHNDLLLKRIDHIIAIYVTNIYINHVTNHNDSKFKYILEPDFSNVVEVITMSNMSDCHRFSHYAESVLVVRVRHRVPVNNAKVQGAKKSIGSDIHTKP